MDVVNTVKTTVKTSEFKYFVFGFLACVITIFAVAGFTGSVVSFTANEAIKLTPLPKCPAVPDCHCPDVKPEPKVEPVAPKKKKGDTGSILGQQISMLDCVDSCHCSGKKTEGCTCFFVTEPGNTEKCQCGFCNCADERIK